MMNVMNSHRLMLARANDYTLSNDDGGVSHFTANSGGQLPPGSKRQSLKVSIFEAASPDNRT
jgi:hypothetical protein